MSKYSTKNRIEDDYQKKRNEKQVLEPNEMPNNQRPQTNRKKEVTTESDTYVPLPKKGIEKKGRYQEGQKIVTYDSETVITSASKKESPNRGSFDSDKRSENPFDHRFSRGNENRKASAANTPNSKNNKGYKKTSNEEKTTQVPIPSEGSIPDANNELSHLLKLKDKKTVDNTHYDKLLSTKGRRYQFVKMEERLAREGVTMATAPIKKTEMGAGISQSYRYSKITTGIIVNEYRKHLDRTLMRRVYKKYDTVYIGDIQARVQKLNKILVKNGQSAIGNELGTELSIKANRQLRRIFQYKKVVSKEALEAYKELAYIGRHTSFHSKKSTIKEALKFITPKLNEAVRSNEMSEGLLKTQEYTKKSYKAAKKFTKGIKSANKVRKKTGEGIVKAGRFTYKELNKHVPEAAVTKKLGQFRDNIYRPYKRKKEKIKKPFKKVNNIYNHFKTRIKRFFNDPLSMKFYMMRIRGYLVDHVAPLRWISHVFGAEGHIASFFKFSFKLSKKHLLFVIGAIASLIFIPVIISMIGGAVGSFHFGATEESLRTKVVNTIKDCYTSDLDYISELDYDSISIEYEDYKTKKTYEEIQKMAKDDSITDFYQATNSAEIISMTMAHFDNDLEEAGETAVLDYVKQLYYGSHEIYIDATTDNDKTSATITYRTYYFDSLFARPLQSDPQRTSLNGLSYGDVGYIEGAKDIYLALRKDGFTHEGACGVLGNLKQESNFNPNSSYKGMYYGIMQIKNERLANMKSWCSKNGYDYTSLTGQTAFLLYEMPIRMKEKGYNPVKTATDVNFAAMEFAAGYEGCIAKGPGKNNHNGRYTGSIYSGFIGHYVQGLYARQANARAFAEQFKAYATDYSGLEKEIKEVSGNKLVDEAKKYVGILPYVWGGTSLTTGADCSGFVLSLYKKIYHTTLPRTSSAQASSSKLKDITQGSSLDVSKLKIGDLIFFSKNSSKSGVYHVAIYSGNGEVVHEPRPGQKCKYSKISWAGGDGCKVMFARRYLKTAE